MIRGRAEVYLLERQANRAALVDFIGRSRTAEMIANQLPK
jgi:hypothetical protein